MSTGLNMLLLLNFTLCYLIYIGNDLNRIKEVRLVGTRPTHLDISLRPEPMVVIVGFLFPFLLPGYNCSNGQKRGAKKKSILELI